jgi:REP element-mobilizing transposase RayT
MTAHPESDRYWFLTWTMYGTWLPGDCRGFVSPVHDQRGFLVLHNLPGTPYDKDHPHLEEYARSRLKGPPIYFRFDHANTCLTQFHETTKHRSWWLLATAVMCNHVHIVVGVPGDPSPRKLLQAYKSYASRALTSAFGRPKSDTWWTESGSKRKLNDEEVIVAAVLYVANQPNPLVLWIAPEFRDIVAQNVGARRAAT